MSELQKKHKQLKRLRIRNITLNTVCILLALAGISWTINYFWKYVHYERFLSDIPPLCAGSGNIRFFFQ